MQLESRSSFIYAKPMVISLITQCVMEQTPDDIGLPHTLAWFIVPAPCSWGYDFRESIPIMDDEIQQ